MKSCHYSLQERAARRRVLEERRGQPPPTRGGTGELPGRGARRRKELRFSWDDRRKQEDWGIQKVGGIPSIECIHSQCNLLLIKLI